MTLDTIHAILFNALILYSAALGIWSAVMAGRNESISGSFWGALAVNAIIAGVVLLIGVIMTLMGLRPTRLTLYFLYMLWMLVIMPGVFSLLRGRDDRSAALAFALLAFFNAAVGVSMFQRGVIGPWLPE